jgi:hypothetical protein
MTEITSTTMDEIITMEEIAETDPVDAAERRASYIRTDLNFLISQRDQVIERIEEARASKDDVVLGYASWTAYVAAEFGGQLAELGREDRRDVVAILSQAGMSSRAIAPIVGADHSTVVRDLRQVVHDAPPADEDDLTVAIAGMRKVMSDHRIPDNEDSRVTGRDGKQYPRPEPKERRKPRRTSLPDAFGDTVYDLAKAVRRLERLTADDRFKDNRESIRASHPSPLSGWPVPG